MRTNVKRRKFLVVVPVLVIPFLTMAFWALGGGSKENKEEAIAKGLNLDLPNANLKEDKLLDKLGFYDKAARDSLKMEEWMRNDPYFKKDTMPFELEELTTSNKYYQGLNLSPSERSLSNPEDQVLKKLKLLEQELNQPAPEQKKYEPEMYQDLPEINYATVAEDPEMKQLQGTLDKILDIQHPERVKLRTGKNREAVYAVRKTNGSDTIVKGFYSYSEEKELEEQNAIEAVIYGDQVLVNGSVVKFRLLDEIYIKGQLIRAGTYINGIASLNNERLEIEINSIRSGKFIYNVKLEVYDVDGLPGIYVPGTITRDAAKEAAAGSLSLMDMTAVDPSFKAQATATGIGAVKNLLSKRSKLIKVSVKTGYKVLLKDKNQNP